VSEPLLIATPELVETLIHLKSALAASSYGVIVIDSCGAESRTKIALFYTAEINQQQPVCLRCQKCNRLNQQGTRNCYSCGGRVK
jgi:hypothetical protein